MPGWRWEAKDASGKVFTGWTSGSRMKSPAILQAHLRSHYRSLDFSQLKCERQDKRPLIVRPMPKDTVEFGTTRMRMEIDAGLRPFSSQLLPPLEHGGEIIIPTNQKLIKPTWRGHK
jgi:hypothetical protein